MKYRTREEFVDIYTFDEFISLKKVQKIVEKGDLIIETIDGFEVFTEDNAIVITENQDIYLINAEDIDNYYIRVNSFEINPN